MTKFKGNGIVWDKDKNSVLCRFGACGTYSTDDDRIITILKSLGYEVLEEVTKKKVKK